MSSLNLHELKIAVGKIQEETKKPISFQVAKIVVMQLESIKDNHASFREALRQALNDAYISEKDQRQLYAKVAGSYFGKRGGRKRKLKRPRKMIKLPPVPPALVEKGGQICLNFQKRRL